jgi:hypothetical protein
MNKLRAGDICQMRDGKAVRVTMTVGSTAYCSDGINRSNAEADRGIVNSNLYSRGLDIIKVVNDRTNSPFNQT